MDYGEVLLLPLLCDQLIGALLPHKHVFAVVAKEGKANERFSSRSGALNHTGGGVTSDLEV